MKKLFLSAIFIAMCISSVKAQFMPQVSGNVEAGLGEQNGTCVGVEYVAGWGLGDRWRLGAGIGFTRMSFDYNNYDDVEVYTTIPIFFDARLNLSKTRVKPFLNSKVGVDILCTDMEYYQYEETNASPAIALGVGVDIPLKKGSLVVLFDYKYRDFDFYESVEGVRLSVGYCWNENKTKIKGKTGTIIY